MGHSSFRALNGISLGQELVKLEKQQNEAIVKSRVLYTSQLRSDQSKENARLNERKKSTTTEGYN